MSSREKRLVMAVATGVMFEVIFRWKFQPYSTREYSPAILPWYLLPILAFLAGWLLTRSLEGKKRWIPLAMLGSFWAANAVLIVNDCLKDPTDHNLWPFEFIIIFIAMLPAFLGAGVSHLMERSRGPGKTG